MITKEEILEEIKRTVKENQGKPLGAKMFRNVTSIHPYDWGRYWARWGDALKEAGFKPNEPWKKYQKGVIEKDAILLIRKLKKYPTVMEMRLEFQNNPNFHYYAIDKKKKIDFIRELIDYCKNKTDYDDVIKICTPIYEQLSSKEETDRDRMDRTIGEVYLVKSGNYYKIGKSNNSMRRGKEIRLQLPEDLKLIHAIKTDDSSGVEEYWHKRFEAKRMRGEWFNLNPSDVKSFKLWRRIV